MSARAARNGPRSGFLLLEAVVGVVLLSLMLALLAQAVALARRIGEGGEARDRLVEAASGLDALGRWIAAAIPVATAPGAPPAFEGRPDGITFVALSDGEVQPGGPLLVSVEAPRLPGGASHSVLRSGPVDADGAASLSGREVLAFSRSALEFSYFGVREPAEAPGWHQSWHAQAPPLLVAVRAQIEAGGRLRPLELVVRVRVRGPGG